MGGKGGLRLPVPKVNEVEFEGWTRKKRGRTSPEKPRNKTGFPEAAKKGKLERVEKRESSKKGERSTLQTEKNWERVKKKCRGGGKGGKKESERRRTEAKKHLVQKKNGGGAEKGEIGEFF